MSVRIYALAKELKIDSKELVDICNKAGVTGKGSALASLSEDEVAKVRSFISTSSRGGGAATAVKGAPVRSSSKDRSIKTLAPSRNRPKAPVSPPKPKAEQKPAPPTPEPSPTPVAEADRPAEAKAPDKAAPPPVGKTDTGAAAEAAAKDKDVDTPVEVTPPVDEKPTADVAEPAAADEGVTAEAPAEEAAEAVEQPSAEEAPAEEARAEESPAEESPAKAEQAPAAEVEESAEPEVVDHEAEEAADEHAVKAEEVEEVEEAGAEGKEPEKEEAEQAEEAEAAAAEKDLPEVPPTRRPSRFQSPLAGRGKIKQMDSPKRGGGGKSGGGKPSKPVVRSPLPSLAPIPQQPEKKTSKPAKKTEKKAQQPIMKLTSDTIRDVKSGKGASLGEMAETAGKSPEAKKTDRRPAEADRSRKGRGAGKGEETEKLAGMAGARQTRKPTRRSKSRSRDDRDDQPVQRRKTRLQRKRKNVSTAAPRKDKVVVQLPCTVRSLSEASGVPTAQILRTLMGLGVMSLNINAQLTPETTELVAEELDLDLEFKQAETLEESMLSQFQQREDSEEELITRPPIVTFLGHVDHGKTSLLDAIIGTQVVAGEAGGITQHIRAYSIDKDGRAISFVDTPGHAAFTEMRARGANVTDICVLVVAADDGVMPQTEEAISHAKAAGVPIVVALNKMDLPGADENRVFQQLSAHELLPSEWGGEVEVVRTSAITGDGIDELLETLLTLAELHELKANPNRQAMGTCLEAEQQAGRGVLAKVMVQNGTLNLGDVVVCGVAHGRIKAMYDALRPSIQHKSAGPSIPVNISGLDTPPAAGERFYVLDDIAKAREIAEARAQRLREGRIGEVSTKISFEDFQRRLEEGTIGVNENDVVELNLIVRADTRGSIEALTKELSQLDHPEVKVKVLQESVGGVTTADVTLAQASHAVIVAFNVIPDEAARSLADDRNVEIRRYDIIYKVTEDVKALLEGKLKPEERVVDLGRAVVKQVFSISRVGAVAGCHVMAGAIHRGCRIRLYRENRMVGDYALDSLRRERDDVREVPRGMECGIKLANFNDIKEQDVLEAYKIEEVARTL